MTVTRKKLIEVALPLDAINAASQREKGNPFLKGHPRTLHQWWARRPLTAARAVLFAQMVDDPSACTEEFPTEPEQETERQRLFQLIEQLVLWENTTNEALLQEARDELSRSWRRTCADNDGDPRAAEFFDPERLPAFHDPFAGGGSLPLEAQRLGLEAHASDLNPVAVLINKAMIEIPPKFAAGPPVNPESREGKGSTDAVWKGAAGLAEDVRYYGKWLRDEAEKRIGHLYPKIEVTAVMARERPDLKPYVGRQLTVIAWLWARTVKSPNPAFASVDVPLASTFMLSTKKGKEAYVEPVIEEGGYRFAVKVGTPPEAAKTGTKLARGPNFQCVMSGAPMSGDHIKAEGKAGGMGARLMAVVAEGDGGRVYLAPTPEHESIVHRAEPTWLPDVEISPDRRSMFTPLYGLTHFKHLFTDRQLVALTTFSDLVGEARERVRADAVAAGMADDRVPLRDGGVGATAYAEAVGVYLAFAISKQADYGNTICTWNHSNQNVSHLFAKQAIPMVWDFLEASPLQGGIAYSTIVEAIADCIVPLSGQRGMPPRGLAYQQDYVGGRSDEVGRVLSTDPPYYDNIGYADLSDFFYVWLRRSLQSVFPDLFATLAVPKAEELVATPYRHVSKGEADAFFLGGMTRAMQRLAEQTHPAFPITIYYAFKQSKSQGDAGVTSTGWETFLDAVFHAGLTIVGTWPVRTERGVRALAIGANALASSIVLVCRSRPTDAPVATRTEFLQELAISMREALPVIALGGVAPVDLAQASIGPGMAVYSKYQQVLRQDGKPVSVREALQDINSAISAYRTERTSSFDERTRFCIDFYDQFGFAEAEFDNATVLARAQDIGVDTLQTEHLLIAERGKAWLVGLKSSPSGVAGLERRFSGSVWEACLRLAVTLEEEGESATASLAQELGEGVCARARELALWLYTIADARRRPQDALAFNALDASWPEVQRRMAVLDRGQQGRLA